MSFSLGAKTLQISAGLFVENRRRLVAQLQSYFGGLEKSQGKVVLLEGGKEPKRYNTDATDLPFRQESYFFWTFGVHESNVYGAIDVYNGRTVLFPPKHPADNVIWLGRIEPESWFREKYQVDDVIFHQNCANILDAIVELFNPSILLLLRAENTDSGSVLHPCNLPKISERFQLHTQILYPIMADLRVYKTDMELSVLRYASKIANLAHMEVMRATKPNMYEYQMESLFRHNSYFHGGCRHLAYTCICGSGENGAILHYGHESAPNAKLIKDDDMCIFDMGPEYNCYASDVTCSFPASGRFSDKQKIVYNAVLKANRAVFEQAKPGVSWVDMHKLAEKIILSDLKDAGILQGDVDEMVKKRLGAIFMPHGLGHFLGLDVHDVGGYLDDALPRFTEPGLKSLRTTRTLKERMCVTIEPGCYFIDSLLDKAIGDPELQPFINVDRLNGFRGVGGVRIEDDIIIWQNGNENMNDELPRTIAEIEEFMEKGSFKKEH